MWVCAIRRLRCQEERGDREDEIILSEKAVGALIRARYYPKIGLRPTKRVISTLSFTQSCSTFLRAPSVICLRQGNRLPFKLIINESDGRLNMIETNKRVESLIRLLNQADEIDENSIIDFKQEPHPKCYKCEFLKDVLALLNSCDRPDEDRWIIYGVENKNRKLVGFDKQHKDLLDDASYQQRICSNIRPRPFIELVTVDATKVLGYDGEGKQFAALYIPCENVGEVYELTKDVEDDCPKPNRDRPISYVGGTSFIRHGSATNILLEEDRIRIRALAQSRTSQVAFPFTVAANGWRGSGITLTDTVDTLCLLGSWDEKNECDQQAIAEMCGLTYPEVIRSIKNELDAGLFAIRKSVWSVQDRDSALIAIGAHLTGASLMALAKHFSSIIASVDEMYAMPEDQRVMANIMGVNRGCSSAARNGIASLCACLANNPGLMPNCTRKDLSTFVYEVIRGVFDADDWRAIASADAIMPLFAQAYPSMYLSVIENSLSDHRSIQVFLEQQSGGVVSSSLGFGLVTGIKIAAMKGECLAQAISLLVAVSPYTDMAKDAIVSALLPWHPQTDASVASRQGMGLFLANSNQPAAWQALMDLLPNKTTSIADITTPKYLKTEDFSQAVTMQEYWDVSRSYCLYALKGFKGSFRRVRDVAANVASFKSAGMLDEMAEAFKEVLPTLDSMERYEIWNILLSYFEKCGKYSHEQWTLSESETLTIKSLIDCIEPDGEYFKALRACSLSDFDLVEADTYEERHDEALAKRFASIKLLHETDGLLFIEKIIKDGAKGNLLGEALSHLALSNDEEQTVLTMLDENPNDNPQRLDVGRSYTWAKYLLNGWGWVNSVSVDGWPNERVARFFASVPFSKECWVSAEKLLGEKSLLFWKEVSSVWVVDNSDDLAHCVKQLLVAKRAAVALETIKFAIDKGLDVDSNLAMDAITAIEPSELTTMCSYYIQEVFAYLEKKSPDDRLCALELQFVTVLHDKSDLYLFKRMAQDPELFLSVVRMAYEPSQNKEEDNGKSASVRWAIQYRVLQNWKKTPGINENGEFDEGLFSKWLTEVRDKARALQIVEGAEYQIGRNLFYAGEGEGFFIPDAMAAFIDSSTSALEGFAIEAFNSRGAHFVDSSGKEEDAIADSYEAKALSAEEHGYANFAAKLRSIAKSFRLEAEENRDNQ